MKGKAVTTINTYWIRLVVIWVVWIFVLGILVWMLIKELRRPEVKLMPEAPLMEINATKVKEVREKLLDK